MAKSKKIVMTGGGTAGHVTPNIALMPALQEAGYEITYIGSYNGMEKELIEAQKIPYIGISSGKLRRYFDWKNFSDPFKVLKGYGQAISILRKLKPDVVFSKGAAHVYFGYFVAEGGDCRLLDRPVENFSFYSQIGRAHV